MNMDQIELTLPNGDVLTMERGVTPGEVASSIGPGLAKAALAAVVNGETVGLMDPLQSNADIRILPLRTLNHFPY